MSIKIDLKKLNGSLSNSNLQNLGKTVQQQKSVPYSELKKELDSKREEFDVWCEANKNAAGSDLYENYVKEFRKWEIQMLAEMDKARTAKEEEVKLTEDTAGDLDEQLNTLLGKCTEYEFILAFLHAKTKDPEIFTTICNKMKLDGNSQPSVTPANPTKVRAALAANPPQLFPASASAPSLSSSVQGFTPTIPSVIPPMYTSPIVEPRPVQPVLLKPERLPPPPKTYAENPKLPFFDIGGSR